MSCGYVVPRQAPAGSADLFQQGLDQLCETVARPVEAALHRAQVATGDVGDLGVALPLELAQHEDGAVVAGELPDALIDRFLEVALAVPDRAVDEIEQSGLVAVDERAEGLPIARQVLEHQPAVVQLVERLALPGAWRGRGRGLLFEGCSHDTGSVVSARNVPDLREDGSIVLGYGTNRTRSDVTPSSLRTARRSGPASAGRHVVEYRPRELTSQRDSCVTGPTETAPYKG